MDIPITFPSDFNLYIAYQELDDEDASDCLDALHDTFAECEIRPEDYEKIGNILLRFSHLVSGGREIRNSNPTSQWLIGLFEIYQKKATALLEASDGPKIYRPS